MSTNALRVVPVVDGIGDAASGSGTHCTSICVNNQNVFLGRANGTIDCYKISSQAQPISIPTAEHLNLVDTGTKKPIVSMASSGFTVVALSMENVYFFPSTADKAPTLLYKGAVAIAVQEQTVGAARYPQIVISTPKRKLVVLSHNGSSYVQESGEISTGADMIIKLAWLNAWVIGASARSYVSVSPSGDRELRDVMLVDSGAAISILKATNEVLLVGQDGLGIFMNVQSDGLFPAPRNTISVNHEDIAVSVLGTYLVLTAPIEGLVDVYPLTTNDPKLIQTINLPSTAIACTNSFSTGIGLASVAGSVLYLLITVPFESQSKKLIDGGNYEEALELVNYHFTPGEERDSRIRDFHRQVGWKLFKDSEFKIAFVHFNLCMRGSDVIEVISHWKSNLKSNESVRIPLAAFLRGQRVLAGTDKTLLSEIETVLLQLLSDQDLVDYVRSHEIALSLSQVKTSVTSPVALALVLEKNGAIKEAVSVLSDHLPSTSSDLIHMLSLHHAQLDDATVESTVAALVKHQAGDEAIKSLILQLKNSIDIIKVIDSPVITKGVLATLATTSTEALNRLLELSISEVDSVTVENLILSRRVDDESWLEKMKLGNFDFARMLLLGNCGKVREALIAYPEHGERYITTVAGTDDQAHVNLVMLLCSVLFEHGENDKALSFLLSNQDLVSAPPAKPSRIVEILPADLAMSVPLIVLLKRINREFRNRARDASIKENLNSFKFLNTYSEWSAFRQSKPVTVSEESMCAICMQSVTDRHNAVAALPNGSVVHPTCMDASSLSAGQATD